MALARLTAIYPARIPGGVKVVAYDREGSMLSFVCRIDHFEWDDGFGGGKDVDVDIHDFGRVQVVYATCINRVYDYVESREPLQKQDDWIMIQSGV